MPACASINCTNRQLRGCGKTFHVFPFSQPEILKKWVISMKRDNWSPSKKSVLCSDHFEQSCFDRTEQTTRLKAGVVPTSFKFPVHLQKCTKKRKQPKERLLPPDADIQCAKEPMAEEMTTPSDISIIQTDHTYFTKESPRAMKHKLDVTSAKLCEMKKRLKVSQQKTRRLHKR
ncbi:THAP domain-containing protein 1-like [Asterias rubens]|uniref:THAP domain-containing protein 1-like n=1 Tax=Asterias rubens TaxID=7604 RepID=UPI0014555C11|nr:THAP domain-containing protein 1-like [Asterias rubens]